MHHQYCAQIVETPPVAVVARKRLLLERAIRLLAIAKIKGARSREAFEATSNLRRIWAIFIDDLESDMLPEDFRASLTSIGLWVVREAEFIDFGKTDDFDSLIEINQMIADGLIRGSNSVLETMAMNWRSQQAILAIHEHLHRIEVGRLSKLERAARELKEEEARIVSYLDDNRNMIAIFPEIVLERLRSNIRRQQDALRAVERQASIALEQAKRVEQAEKLVANARRERERALARDVRWWMSDTSSLRDISAA